MAKNPKRDETAEDEGSFSDLVEQPAAPITGRTNFEDGSSVVQDGENTVVLFDGAEEIDDDINPNFDENLAELLSRDERRTLAYDIVEMVELDEEARRPYVRLIDRGMELMGFTDITETGAAFGGGATVTYPMVGEAVVQFNARTMGELFPPEGAVRTKIVGKQTEEKLKQAERVQNFMNYHLSEVDEEYQEDVDLSVNYYALTGSVFSKPYKDPISGNIISRHITVDNLIVPYDAANLRDAPRYTWKYPLSYDSIMRGVDDGAFISEAEDSIVRSPQGLINDSTEGEKNLADKADYREPVRYHRDEVYQIYQCHAEIAIDGLDDEEGKPYALPYKIIVERESLEVLSIKRLWDENDPKCQKRVEFVHHKFLPGFGFYGLGYLQLIGGLAAAAGGSMRSLLDSAVLANLQGGFKSKEAGDAAGEAQLVPGVWVDIDLGADELKNAFYTPPFKEPSKAMFELFSILTDIGRRYSNTTDTMIGDANTQAPVGTTVAMIEQASKLQTGIHKRLHNSKRIEYRIIAELLRSEIEAAGGEYPYEIEDEDEQVAASDFDSRIDIVPISDPNVFSVTQRIAVAQAVLELTNQNPDVYQGGAIEAAHKNMMTALRVPQDLIDSMLPDTKVLPADPVAENMMMMSGGMVQCFMHQHHEAHIAVHENLIAHIESSGDPDSIQMVLPVLTAHMREHAAWNWRQQIEEQMGIALPIYFDPNDVASIEDREPLPADIDWQVSEAVVQALLPPPPTEEQLAEQEQAEQTLTEAEAREQSANMAAMGDLERKNAAHAAEEQRKQTSFDAQQYRDKLKHQQEQRASRMQKVEELRQIQLKNRLELENEEEESEAKIKEIKKTGAAKRSIPNVSKQS